MRPTPVFPSAALLQRRRREHGDEEQIKLGKAELYLQTQYLKIRTKLTYGGSFRACCLR